MVAKTYLTWKQDGQPFLENKRMYVNVINPTNSKIKKVRWYSNQEFKRMYPELAAAVANGSAEPDRRKIFGFNPNIKVYFNSNLEKSNARFHKVWGWYLPGNEVLVILPNNFTGNVFTATANKEKNNNEKFIYLTYEDAFGKDNLPLSSEQVIEKIEKLKSFEIEGEKRYGID